MLFGAQLTRVSVRQSIYMTPHRSQIFLETVLSFEVITTSNKYQGTYIAAHIRR